MYFGGRNWITRRKPAESHWQTIMFYRVHLTMCSIHTHYFNNGDRQTDRQTGVTIYAQLTNIQKCI